MARTEDTRITRYAIVTNLLDNGAQIAKGQGPALGLRLPVSVAIIISVVIISTDSGG